MGVVYILHGSKFVSAELTKKRVNIFLHFSWLKFLVCIVLEVDFSSRIWRSNWYYADIFRGSTVPSWKDWWWVLPSGEMPTAIIKFVLFQRMSLALKKGENFKSLTEWVEYNFRELWVRYFPTQTYRSTGRDIGTLPLMSRFFIFVCISVVISPRSLVFALDPVVQCFSVAELS
jgi:hypothetical protein